MPMFGLPELGLQDLGDIDITDEIIYFDRLTRNVRYPLFCKGSGLNNVGCTSYNPFQPIQILRGLQCFTNWMVSLYEYK